MIDFILASQTARVATLLGLFAIVAALAYLVLCAALTGAPLLQFGYRQAQARALAKMMYFIAFWGGLSAAVSGMIVASVRNLS